MSEERSAHPPAGQICVRCFVAGHVQGVFFRASAREEAQRRGITGYAKNLADGRVEVLACGEVDAINELKGWLGHGPSGAQVTGVACEPVDYRPLSGFTAS